MSVDTWILGLVALGSLASVVAGRPWTTLLAKRHTPPEVWPTALFRETNLVLSGGWSLLFAGAAGLTAVAPLWVNVAYGALLGVSGFLTPKLGSWYAARRLRAMGVQERGTTLQ